MIVIAPIVEGHGDNSAVRDLLQRVWRHLGGDYAHVVTPIRRSRGKLLKEEDDDLGRAIQLALAKARQVPGAAASVVLLLVDAEDDCRLHGSLGPRLLDRAHALRSDIDISCVVANPMFETWFVAAAESLGTYLKLDRPVPIDPEFQRAGKGWIRDQMKSGRYSETVDQPRLAAIMDLQLAAQRSPSFDKLCRELRKRLHSA